MQPAHPTTNARAYGRAARMGKGHIVAKPTKPAVPAQSAAQQAATPAQAASNTTQAPATTGQLRLPFVQAHAHNKQHGLLAAGAPVVAANVALTARGTNPSKRRVYGYGNLAQGGRVPVHAVLAVVAGAGLPRGVSATQWAALQAQAGNTVQAAYGAGVSSRTVRRAYRAGCINFVQP